MEGHIEFIFVVSVLLSNPLTLPTLDAKFSLELARSTMQTMLVYHELVYRRNSTK